MSTQAISVQQKSWVALVFAMLLILMAGCAASGTSRSTGAVIDDTAITAKIKAELVRDRDVSATAVNVETFNGVVQLSGFADSQAEITRAVSIARKVDGVKSVKNDLRIKPKDG